jgi:hypothetical protein
MVSSRLSSAELHLASGKSESPTDRIRGIGTRILREGEDADFGAGDGMDLKRSAIIAINNDAGQGTGLGAQIPSVRDGE